MRCGIAFVPMERIAFAAPVVSGDFWDAIVPWYSCSYCTAHWESVRPPYSGSSSRQQYTFKETTIAAHAQPPIRIFPRVPMPKNLDVGRPHFRGRFAEHFSRIIFADFSIRAFLVSGRFVPVIHCRYSLWCAGPSSQKAEYAPTLFNPPSISAGTVFIKCDLLPPRPRLMAIIHPAARYGTGARSNLEFGDCQRVKGVRPEWRLN